MSEELKIFLCGLFTGSIIATILCLTISLCQTLQNKKHDAPIIKSESSGSWSEFETSRARLKREKENKKAEARGEGRHGFAEYDPELSKNQFGVPFFDFSKGQTVRVEDLNRHAKLNSETISKYGYASGGGNAGGTAKENKNGYGLGQPIKVIIERGGVGSPGTPNKVIHAGGNSATPNIITFDKDGHTIDGDK